MTLSFPLTISLDQDYPFSAADNTATEIGLSNVGAAKAAKRYAMRLFLCLSAPFMGGHGEGRKAISAPTDKSNSSRSAHPIGLGKAVTQPTYRSSKTMKAALKSAIAPISKSTNEEFRTGAAAGLSTLRTINRIVDHYRNGEVDSKSYFRDRELIKAAMVSAAGTDSAFLKGFVTTLAEYIDTFMQDSSGPMLDVWKPESMMTPSEIRFERAQLFEGEEVLSRIASFQGESA